MQEEYNLSHLKELEAESIHIILGIGSLSENPLIFSSQCQKSK